jgi:hypothetical protein
MNQAVSHNVTDFNKNWHFPLRNCKLQGMLHSQKGFWAGKLSASCISVFYFGSGLALDLWLSLCPEISML